MVEERLIQYNKIDLGPSRIGIFYKPVSVVRLPWWIRAWRWIKKLMLTEIW